MISQNSKEIPNKVRRNKFLLLFVLLCNTLMIGQTKHQCLDVDQTGIIERAYDSFEKDLFTYYNFGNDTIKTYRTFLAEVTSLSLALKKFPSQGSIQLTRQFKSQSKNKNSIWVRLEDYENQGASKKAHLSTSMIKNEEEILIFNYRRGFIQCLKNSNDSEDFKGIISNLENNGNVSTSLIAQKIYYLNDEEINTWEIKNFVAFDIYYSILMVVEKAF